VAIVLIIGASRGIGLETVNAALEPGHSVRALARSARRIPVDHLKWATASRVGGVRYLLLRQAQASRAGDEGDDDYDVIGPEGIIISLKNLRHYWNACSRTSAAGASMVVELLAEVPIAATLRRIGPIPAQVDGRRRRHSIGGDDGAQCDTVKDGAVVGLLDPRPHGPHDRGGFHSHSAAPDHRNVGPTGSDGSMSNCDVPGSNGDASMSGCDVTGSGDASMPNCDVTASDADTSMSNCDVTGHRDISTECGGFDSRYC
jgi:hypothetical protein